MPEEKPFYLWSEFWIAIVNAIVKITLLVVAQYYESDVLELTKLIVDQLQALVIMIIVGMLGNRVREAVIGEVRAIVAKLRD